MHGFHVDEAEKAINLDIIIDFAANDSAKIYRAIYDEIQENYPEYSIEVTLDIDTSD
jgi:tRNA threonylcarbamoyladenosine modification (KEOPS) complex  Pcc1 subunit